MHISPFPGIDESFIDKVLHEVHHCYQVFIDWKLFFTTVSSLRLPPQHPGNRTESQPVIYTRKPWECCCCCCLVSKSCLTLCNPTDCSVPGLPVKRIMLIDAEPTQAEDGGRVSLNLLTRPCPPDIGSAFWS